MFNQVRDLSHKAICKEQETFKIYYLSYTFINLDALLHTHWEIKIEKGYSVTINGRKTSDFWDGTIHANIKPLRMKIRNICGDETIITLTCC